MKKGLSLERVVEAAVEVADAEGLESVSMSRVAKQLDVSAMALYRHVATKDELVALMVDTALGAPPPPAGGGWRESLVYLAEAMRARLLEHPWTALAPVTGPPSSPNQLTWLDRVLHALRDTGLDEAEQLFCALLLSTQVQSGVALAVTVNRNPAAAALAAGYSDFLDRATADGRLPEVRRLVRAGVFAGAEMDMSMETEFRFGLERILDGIGALVRVR
ncbi:TetR/AcrR family transcriptional regulator [Nonomuraea soli]|uniref:AcrR family transcriptional regulator n=1 Tax=Nonomuraea soli TaxID=1032476 RepID=A0A7W0CHC3_9ACTN|nr:TetR/AcrR family transcriptional regulator [Nonomuraea soli]MBA2891059.1 AcrR family transcriptional regulator [Nonomuraea soli]